MEEEEVKEGEEKDGKMEEEKKKEKEGKEKKIEKEKTKERIEERILLVGKTWKRKWVSTTDIWAFGHKGVEGVAWLAFGCERLKE